MDNGMSLSEKRVQPFLCKGPKLQKKRGWSSKSGDPEQNGPKGANPLSPHQHEVWESERGTEEKITGPEAQFTVS